jgi:virginiamycin B lyase
MRTASAGGSEKGRSVTYSSLSRLSASIGHLTAEGDVIRIVIPSPPSTPQDIVRGPDGNMWFTELDAGSLGRITPQGVIKRFPIAAEDGRVGPRVAGAVSQPVNLAVGPDGDLWFTDQGLNAIGRMTTSGEVVTFPIPTADAYPAGIAAGGDGNLYFTESEPGRVARITLAGVITELGTPDPDSFPLNLTLGPDGAMWFTEFYGGHLGRLARDGRISKFALRGELLYPANMVRESDGSQNRSRRSAARAPPPAATPRAGA